MSEERFRLDYEEDDAFRRRIINHMSSQRLGLVVFGALAIVIYHVLGL